GCSPTCRGDSCSRPQSTKDKLVIWWPPQMRVEPGPSGERADYQTISLER
ncbi:type III secretion protein, partial [Pseudomonas sp. ABAC21]